MAKKKATNNKGEEPVKEEVATRPEALVPDVARGLFDTRENLKGLEPRLPQIKILHGESQMFRMPDESKVDKIVGPIIDFNRCNAYWIESFVKSGGGTPPDCASLDGIELDPMCESPQSKTGKCKQCPMNVFGSEPPKPGEDESRGKACKNMMRVHILIEGQLMPFRLTLPPTSLKVIDEYIPMVESRGFPYQLTMTELSLKVAKNKKGIVYSQLVCKDVGRVDSTEKAFAIKNFIDEWRSVMRGQEIESDEYGE